MTRCDICGRTAADCRVARNRNEREDDKHRWHQQRDAAPPPPMLMSVMKGPPVYAPLPLSAGSQKAVAEYAALVDAVRASALFFNPLSAPADA